jgi:hypothetical protein
MEFLLLKCHMVKPGVVNFDGAVLTPEKKVYILLNKPKILPRHLTKVKNSVMF